MSLPAGHNGASQNTDPNLPTKAEHKSSGRSAAAEPPAKLVEAREAAARLKQHGNQWHSAGNYVAAAKAYKEVLQSVLRVLVEMTAKSVCEEVLHAIL